MVKMADINVNELICFFLTYVASIPLASLCLTISNFYSEDDLRKRKTILHDLCVKKYCR